MQITLPDCHKRKLHIMQWIRHRVSKNLLPPNTFNGLFSRTTRVSQYQKGKTSLDLNEAKDDGVLGWQWHQLDYNICKQSAPRSRQITTTTPHCSIFTGRMLFLTPNQQCQSIESTHIIISNS